MFNLRQCLKINGHKCYIRKGFLQQSYFCSGRPNACQPSAYTWCRRRFFHRAVSLNSLPHENQWYSNDFSICDEDIEAQEPVSSYSKDDADLEKLAENFVGVASEVEHADESKARQPATVGTVRTELATSLHFFYNYLRACVDADLVPEAVDCVLQRAAAGILVKDVKIFELLLKAVFAQTGVDNQHRVQTANEIFNTMPGLQIQPSPLIHAYMVAITRKFAPRQRVNLRRRFDAIAADRHTTTQQCYDALHRGSEVARCFRDAAASVDRPLPDDRQREKTRHAPGSNPRLRALFDEQLGVELRGQVEIPNVLHDAAASAGSNPAGSARMKRADDLHAAWRASLAYSFRNLRQDLLTRWRRNHLYQVHAVAPFLCVLPERDYVEIMIRVMKSLPLAGALTSHVCVALGDQVYNSYVINERRRAAGPDQADMYVDYHDGAGDSFRRRWVELESRYERADSVEQDCVAWTPRWKFYVGLRLLELMISNLTVNIGDRPDAAVPSAYFKQTPAVFNSYKPWGKRMYGMTIPHPLYVKLVQGSASFTFNSNMLPMLVPPKPWVRPGFGGFLACPTDYVRSSGSAGHLDGGGLGRVESVSDALNVIGSVGWKINKRVLDIQLAMFRAGGDQQLLIPPPGTAAPPAPSLSRMSSLATGKERYALRQAFNHAKKVEKEMHALHCDGLYKFSIAEYFRDRTFWLPHNMDFRGRVYPVPPHFNYMGADVNRSLFRFAEGRPLGQRGLDWLKIHLVNLTGLKKKESNQARLEFADQIMDEIVDSAERPLEGGRWWTRSDEPWQTLSACIELVDALRSGNPHDFVSDLPVYQDGSCNGLQHYAALGRDLDGARQVNLAPAETPQDIYSGVAANVERFRSRDAAHGVKIAQLLDGHVTRKVVKQTVMTTVYGVTRYGGSDQIRRQLLDIRGFPKEEARQAANYLVVQVFRGLDVMFTGASEIKKWLRSIATCLSQGGVATEWVTPLGLHVRQPYHKSREVLIDSRVQRVNFRHAVAAGGEPDARKQRNAFPPNFVHSLDSTHMLMTAIHCHRAGVVFSAVHDCYWTHARDVERMNRACRDQFVRLHARPLLRDLARHLAPFADPGDPATPTLRTDECREQLLHLLRDIPARGEFDLAEVKKSEYFFC